MRLVIAWREEGVGGRVGEGDGEKKCKFVTREEKRRGVS